MTPEDLKKEAWTWSFSKFKKFLECQEQYRLEYLVGPRIPPLSQKPFFQGSVAHKVIEETKAMFDRQETHDFRKSFELLDGVFNRYATDIQWGGDMEIETSRQEARDILANYIALIEQESLDQGEVLCEHWFGTHAAPMDMGNGLFWVGAIDWLKLDRSAGTASIYDAKTSKGTSYLDKRQLVMYARAVERSFGVKVTSVNYLMLRWNKVLRYPVTEEEMQSVEAEMIRASKAAESQSLSANPSMALCAKCQYSGKCSPYGNWIINDGRTGEVEW